MLTSCMCTLNPLNPPTAGPEGRAPHTEGGNAPCSDAERLDAHFRSTRRFFLGWIGSVIAIFVVASALRLPTAQWLAFLADLAVGYLGVCATFSGLLIRPRILLPHSHGGLLVRIASWRRLVPALGGLVTLIAIGRMGHWPWRSMLEPQVAMMACVMAGPLWFVRDEWWVDRIGLHRRVPWSRKTIPWEEITGIRATMGGLTLLLQNGRQMTILGALMDGYPQFAAFLVKEKAELVESDKGATAVLRAWASELDRSARVRPSKSQTQ
jgi:hypothetical protein